MVNPLTRRASVAFRGAAIVVLALAVVWFVAHEVAFGRSADASILRGFIQLHRPRINHLTGFVARLCSAQPYVELAAIPVAMALLRGRPRVAVTVGVILLGANETTQLLKPILAGPRDMIWWGPLGTATFPSGHATAAMSLALTMVIAAPARYRPTVAAGMAAFAVAVCYSFLELGWHYPSDVLGGFLVATAWTLVGVGALSLYEAGRPARALPPVGGRRAFSIAEVLAPPAALLLGAAVFAVVIVLIRPHAVVSYARGHEAFVIGAAAIAAIGFTLASGLNLILRRS